MTDSLSKGERLRHQRIDFAAVADFVREHHRHHTPPIGHIFSLAAFLGDRMVGVAIVGRPVARHRDDGLTAEITRLCVIEGVRNAASFLLGACARAGDAPAVKDPLVHFAGIHGAVPLAEAFAALDRGQRAALVRLADAMVNPERAS
jgi:hypothetical protein